MYYKAGESSEELIEKTPFNRGLPAMMSVALIFVPYG